MDKDRTEVLLTLATATVRVIGSLLELDEGEIEGAASAVTLWHLTSDTWSRIDERRAILFSWYILSRNPYCSVHAVVVTKGKGIFWLRGLQC